MAMMMAMSRYSVAEAKNNFSRVLAEAEGGQRVSITRRGKVVAELVPVASPTRFVIDVEALKRRRVQPRRGVLDTLAALEEMRADRPS